MATVFKVYLSPELARQLLNDEGTPDELLNAINENRDLLEAVGSLPVEEVEADPNEGTTGPIPYDDSSTADDSSPSGSSEGNDESTGDSESTEGSAESGQPEASSSTEDGSAK